MRLVPKRDLPLDVLLKRIEEAGRQMLSCVPVRVIQRHGKIKKGKIDICSQCGEAYPTSQGDPVPFLPGEWVLRTAVQLITASLSTI